jgi:hypothetical protein
LISISKSTNTSEFLVVLKVTKELILNKDLFILKYKHSNTGYKDVSKFINKLKQVVEYELVNDIKQPAPGFSTYLDSFCYYLNSDAYYQLFENRDLPKYKFEKFWTTQLDGSISFLKHSQIDSSTKRKNVLLNKISMINVAKEMNRNELYKQQSNEFYNDTNNELIRSTTALLYLVKIIPFLSLFDYCDSNSSEVSFSDSSEDEIGTLKGERNNIYEDTSVDPFPVYKYNKKLLTEASYRENILSSNSGVIQGKQKIEELIPFFFMSYSYNISGNASYSIQKLFVENENSRVYILDQLAYVIKELQEETFESAKQERYLR